MAASPTPARRRYPRSEAASPARMRECSQKDAPLDVFFFGFITSLVFYIVGIWTYVAQSTVFPETAGTGSSSLTNPATTGDSPLPPGESVPQRTPTLAPFNDPSSASPSPAVPNSRRRCSWEVPTGAARGALPGGLRTRPRATARRFPWRACRRRGSSPRPAGNERMADQAARTLSGLVDPLDQIKW
nr:uncharacterized protein LOC127328793 [Lolium perenne]